MTMQYRRLGTSGLTVSRVASGHEHRRHPHRVQRMGPRC